VDDGLVLTAAHVVAGATSIDVSHAGRTEPGTLVAFDPRNDLAMLLVAGDLAAPIRLGSNDGSTTGSAVVFRAGAAVALPVEVVRSVNIDTTDIYDEAKVSRPGYELRVQIEAGDSGAGVIIDGKAVAVLWSRSRERDDRAWAIDPIAGGAAIRAQLAGGARPQDRCRD
jgi:S1-C subfamily serine protease